MKVRPASTAPCSSRAPSIPATRSPCWIEVSRRLWQGSAGTGFLLSFNVRYQGYVSFSNVVLVVHEREESSSAHHTNDLARLGTPGPLINVLLDPGGDYPLPLFQVLVGK